jgi:rare lipoprotein A
LRGRRLWLVVNIAVTVALLPALFSGPEPAERVGVAAGTMQTVPAAAHLEAAGDGDVRLAPTAAADAATVTTSTTSTTSTTAAPPPASSGAATSTTARPTTVTAHSHPSTTTTTAHSHPSTTTTTAHTHPPTTTTTRPTPTTTTAPAPERTEEGKATWYELEGARAGICAHKTLPFGTVVTVTNTATGGSITCEVGDRGPFVDGYVIDLYRTDFERLAPTSKGWFPARLSW